MHPKIANYYPFGKKEKRTNYLHLLINLCLLLFICASVYTSLKLNLTDRSLWLDEAMLAFSFSQRSLPNLTSDIFEWMQSAPVIYLYVVKIITSLFGNTEFTLRLWSFISYLLLLVSIYYISKTILKTKYPLFAVAFIANLSKMIQYSAEFKPYMSDCLCVCIILIVYHLYTEKKLNQYYTIAIYAIMVWFSNPCCFFIGSVLLIEFAGGISTKDYAKCRKSVLAGIIILISFGIYYLYWLKPVIDAGGMTNFWKDKNFPLIPMSIEDLQRQKSLVKEIIFNLGTYQYLIFSFFGIGVFINIFSEKNRFINVIYAGMLITLFASMLGMYPVQDRLYLFIYPIFSILFFYYLGKLYSSKPMANILVVATSCIILLSTNGVTYFKHEDNVYRLTEEINPAISYLRESMQADDKLYVYHLSIPAFSYKNEYDTTSFAGNKNNIILGENTFENNQNRADIDRIIQNAPIYILTSHTGEYPERITPLIDGLQKRGNLQLVHNKYETNTYYFTRNDSVK